MGWSCRMEEGRSAFKILTGTPTGKRLLRRPRHRWEHDIRIDLKEAAINTRNCVIPLRIGFIGALVNAALYLRVP